MDRERSGLGEGTSEGMLKSRLEQAGEKSFTIWQWTKNNFRPEGGKRLTTRLWFLTL